MTEFLICAPILALLAFAAYDMNKRIEDQETATVLARNAVYLGDGLASEQQLSAAGTVAQNTGNHVDAAENEQMGRAADGSGIGVAVQTASVADGDLNRVRTPDGLATEESFASLSSITGELAFGGAKALNALESAGQAGQLLMAEAARTGAVETVTTGPANLIQTSVASLVRAVTHDDGAATQAAGLERRFGDRFYLRGESGFHPSGFTTCDIPGIALGLTRGELGAGDDFGDRSKTLQTRCFSRFWQSDACGGHGAPGRRAASQYQHTFAVNVGSLAELKATLSLIAKVTPVSAAADEAVDQAIKMAGETLTQEVVTAVVDKVVNGLAQQAGKTVQDAVDGQLSALAEAPVPGGDDALNPIAPTALDGALTGR